MKKPETEEIITPVVSTEKPKIKYRYFCTACTGIAFYSTEMGVVISTTCAACNKSIGQMREENFIPLTPQEMTRFNNLPSGTA